MFVTKTDVCYAIFYHRFYCIFSAWPLCLLRIQEATPKCLIVVGK